MNGSDHMIYLFARHNHGKDVPQHDLESLREVLKAHGFVIVLSERTTNRRLILEAIAKI